MVVVVNKSGALEKVTVAQKSRHSILNKAAIKATERAAPFPALPAALNTDEFEITVPVTFKLQLNKRRHSSSVPPTCQATGKFFAKSL
jgi:protein TonB